MGNKKLFIIFIGFNFPGYQSGNWPTAPMGFRPQSNNTRGFYGGGQPAFPSMGARLLYGPGSQPRWGHRGYY